MTKPLRVTLWFAGLVGVVILWVIGLVSVINTHPILGLFCCFTWGLFLTGVKPSLFVK